MATIIDIQQIEQLLKPLLDADPEYFCIGMHVKPINNIKIFLEGDKGISIEKCVQFNRQLNKIMEEMEIYSLGDFSLEVSSPGIEEPLKLQRQYVKNIGRPVEVVFTDGTKKEGDLREVTDTDITIEHTEGKGKKLVTQKIVIPFNNIKTTTVQIKF